MARPRRARSVRSILSGVWGTIRWPLIAGLAVLALVLGWIGFGSVPAPGGAEGSFWDRLYLSLQLFALESGAVEPPVPWSLEVARVLAPAVTFFAAVSAILAVFAGQIARARVRWFARDHVVVCGVGRTGHALIDAFRERGDRVVAIERNPAESRIAGIREAGVAVLVGDATDRAWLAQARVDRARYLFAVAADDGANATIAVASRELLFGRRGAPLVVFVRILDADLAEALGIHLAAMGSGALRLEVFNPAERAAPALLNEHPPFDRAGATPFGPPHILVVGAGEMGSRLILHAARRWKAVHRANGRRLRVAVADRDADRHVEDLLLRWPGLGDVCELIPHRIEVESPRFERGEPFRDPGGGCSLTAAYICLGDDALALAAGLRLGRALRDRDIPIVVRTKAHDGLGSLLRDDLAGTRSLHVFGVLDATCRPEVILGGRTEVLARAIHHEYVRRQQEEGHSPGDNPSMVSWDELPEHLKESNRWQADDIGNKLRAVGCDLEVLDGFEPD
ncbi:MAG: potassium channel family protein, partial [Actinomycetota bacterium]